MNDNMMAASALFVSRAAGASASACAARFALTVFLCACSQET
jgi:hypothetical protein